MIYLIVSIAAMSALACVFRLAMLKGAGPLGFNAVYRGTAALLYLAAAGMVVDWSQLPRLWSEAGPLGLVAAAFFWMSGFAGIKVAQLGPIGIGWTVLRCSMVIATAASLVYWKEVTPATPGLFVSRLAGILVIMAAAILFGIGRVRGRTAQQKKTQDLRRWFAWMAVAFFCMGGWEICLRATKESLQGDQARFLFLTLVFVVAGGISLPVMKALKARIGRTELLYGSLAAIFSAVGSGLRPWAIQELGGVIVFPATTISVIVLVQILGTAIWRERLRRVDGLAFACAIAGILLLTLQF